MEYFGDERHHRGAPHASNPLPKPDYAYGATRPPGTTYQMGGCGIAGVMALDGSVVSGDRIASMLTTMGERENGLGAGYACYGLFPQHLDEYCFQVFFDDEEVKKRVEEFLKDYVEIHHAEKVFHRPVQTMTPPFPNIWRYFVTPKPGKDWFGNTQLGADDFIIQVVMHVNSTMNGAQIVSSGKNMAVFKGNGFSYEIADFYDISRYKGNLWISHSRFPTNSPAWWAGAHPMSVLDWGVCHNGEITSYGVNKKLVEMNGYKCTVQTDTEVIAYIWDLLVRRHKMPIQAAAFAMAPWTHEEIATLDPDGKKLATWLRIAYREAFLNGPFSILVGRSQPEITLIALADRKKLRPMLVGKSPDDKFAFCASEECAVRTVQPDALTWTCNAGSPFIAQVGKGIIRAGIELPFEGAKK